MIHISLRKKILVAQEHKRRNVCNFSRTDFLFFVKMTKSGKEVIYRKKNGGHPAFKRVKSLQSSQSNCDYSLCHATAWHFWEDLGPQLFHDATCFHVPFLWKMFAPLASCLPSWSAMDDECVTCSKKFAVAMGANVLNTIIACQNMKIVWCLTDLIKRVWKLPILLYLPIRGCHWWSFNSAVSHSSQAEMNKFQLHQTLLLIIG